MIFFDDYANCMLLGNTLAPVFDRLKLSREKLSYIVDSTAAPVAGLAVVSTWIAVELAYLQEGLANTGAADAAAASPFELFVACIPYRFYVIQALLLVMLIAVLNRDIGPMLARNAARPQRRHPVMITPLRPPCLRRIGSPRRRRLLRRSLQCWCSSTPPAA